MAHPEGKRASVSTYTAGCHCAECREQMRQYQSWRRQHQKGEATKAESPCASTRLVKPADLGKRDGSEAERVQIALARGVRTVDVMAIWELTYEQLKAIRDEMVA